MRVFRRYKKDGTPYKKWYVEVAGFRWAGFSDKRLTEELGNRIQRLSDFLEAGSRPDKECLAWLASLSNSFRALLEKRGLIDAKNIGAIKSVQTHLEEWKQSLINKEASERYTREAPARVRRGLTEMGCVRIMDLKASAFQNWLQQKRRRDGSSTDTLNNYLSSFKAFASWATRSGYLPENPLRHISDLNNTEAPRHPRRVSKPEEITTLLETTLNQPFHHGLTGRQRFMLYYLILSTSGLRWKEAHLAEVKDLRFNHDSGTLTVRRGVGKAKKKESILPLLKETIPVLQSYIEDKEGTDRIFPGMWKGRGADMLRADLEAAGIAYLTADGYLDFHSLRKTFISRMANAGTPVAILKEWARHSDIRTTMRHYVSIDQCAMSDAVEKLPSVLPTEQLPAFFETAENRGPVYGPFTGPTRGTAGDALLQNTSKHTSATDKRKTPEILNQKGDPGLLNLERAKRFEPSTPTLARWGPDSAIC